MYTEVFDALQNELRLRHRRIVQLEEALGVFAAIADLSGWDDHLKDDDMIHVYGKPGVAAGTYVPVSYFRRAREALKGGA